MTTMRMAPGSSAVAGAIALALAVGAAIALGAADAVWRTTAATGGPELTLVYLVGWVLLWWAAVVALAVAAHLVRSLAGRRRVRRGELVVALAAVAVVAGVIIAHPVAGSGEGAAASTSLQDGTQDPAARADRVHAPIL